jgi:subtilisin-like proprotein convertase family protein
VRMKRTHLGTAIGATAASIALGMTLAGPAGAASPDPPLGSAAGEFAANSPGGSVAIPDNTPAGISKTITVTGQTGTIRAVDVITSISNLTNGDAQIDLTHTPPGASAKSVRFVTQRLAGRGGVNGFNGTRWDDSALGIVTEQDFGVSGPKLNLVPETTMGSLIGRNPNGTWTVTVKDLDPLGPAGSFDSWRLELKTLNSLPATVSQSSGPGGTGDIPDFGGGSLVRTVQVSGAKTYLADVDLITSIRHEFAPGDLQMKLTSPSGTTVFLSNRRGNGSAESLSTRWDDSAAEALVLVEGFWGGATNPGTRPALVPEGGLSAFIGENPNGTWTLTLADAEATEVGQLRSWSLNLTSTDGGGAPLPGPGQVVPPPLVALPPLVCAKVNLATTILGAKRGERGENATIRVKVANKTKGAGARSAKAVFKLPTGFTLVKGQKGISLKKGKITATFGAIAGGKAKTLAIKLKTKDGAKLGLKTSSVAVSALCGSKAKAATIKLTVAA